MNALPPIRPLLSTLAGLMIVMAVTNLASAEPHRVLILTPFSRDTEPFTAAVSSFRTTLAAELGEPLDVQEVPLDLALFTDAAGELPLVSLIEKRLTRKPVDLVVPVGGAAVQFAHRHRARLFPEAPVLVLAAAPRLVPEGFLDRNATLITEPIDLPGMVEDILRMRPDTRQIAVVFGSSPLEKLWASECRREFASLASRVDFLWLDGLTLEETLERCGELPRDSFILHGLFLEDAIGVPCEKNLALRKLRETANAPVFAYFASELGQGPVGGHLFQNGELGVQAARVAIRILQGEQAGSIEPRILERAAPEYDWRELQRWNIAESDLPANAVIRFRQPGFWELYRWPLSGVILLGLFQAALIIGLLAQRRRRRQSEAETALMADISSKFVNLPSSQTDHEIFSAQRRICELMDLDMSVLWQWSEKKPGSFIATHVYSLQHGQQPQVEMVDEDFPWVRQELLAGRVVAHRSLDELPAEAAKDRESAGKAGIKSHLTLPLCLGGESPIGILGFNTSREERSWQPSLVERLHLFAEIIANALARKKADQALRESERRQTLAAESAEAGLWEYDWVSQLFSISKKARAVFGFATDEAVTLARFEESIHPQDRHLIHDGFRQAAADGTSIDLEYRIRPKGGDERWILSRGRPFFTSTGEPERLLGLSMDITLDKLAKEKMRQLSHVVEQSPALVIITDLKGRIVYVNQKFTEVSGYTMAECLGRNPRILKSGESPPETYKELWSRISAGKSWQGEFHNRRKNGELYWERAVISPLSDAAGTITHYVGIKEDITEAKLAEVALRSSEELNRLTFEEAAVGIAHVGMDGRWLRVNDRLCEIVGYPRDELLQLTFLDITHPDDAERNHDHERQILAGETAGQGLEKRYLRKDGTTIWVNLNASLVRNEKGEPKHFITLVEDITEHRKAKLQIQELSQTLAHAGRVTLLGQLASSLAHELSQPLGAILRNAEAAEILLGENAPDMEEMKAIVDDILRDDRRAGEVINKLRSLLRKGTLDLQPLRLPEVVDEVLTLLRPDAEARFVTITSSLRSNLPQVLGDRVHLQQVLLNLIINAMDALDPVKEGERRIEVHAALSGPGLVEVQVRDNGPRIPDEQLGQLFEPFFTTKSSGMGMGLAVSRTLVEALGGRLWAEVLPESGTCFRFTLKTSA